MHLAKICVELISAAILLVPSPIEDKVMRSHKKGAELFLGRSERAFKVIWGTAYNAMRSLENYLHRTQVILVPSLADERTIFTIRGLIPHREGENPNTQ